MKVARLIIISLVIFSAVIMIISLFIPSHVTISQAIQINRATGTVMQQLVDPEKWKNWYPGADSLKYYREGGAIKGRFLNSKNDRLIISEKQHDKVTAIYVSRRRKIPTVWQVISVTDSSSTTVQWHLDFFLRWYPWEKFSSFMFEKVYNPQLKAGLENLKAYLEK